MTLTLKNKLYYLLLYYPKIEFVPSDPPPCTVDFLTPLRNQFAQIISPRLDISARKALEQQKPVKAFDDRTGRKLRQAILDAVYGRIFLK